MNTLPSQSKAAVTLSTLGISKLSVATLEAARPLLYVVVCQTPIRHSIVRHIKSGESGDVAALTKSSVNTLPDAWVSMRMLNDLRQACNDGGGRVSAAAALSPGTMCVTPVQIQNSLSKGLCETVALIAVLKAEAISFLGYLHDALQVWCLPCWPGTPQLSIKFVK